jgi:hypothetical protein
VPNGLPVKGGVTDAAIDDDMEIDPGATSAPNRLRVTYDVSLHVFYWDTVIVDNIQIDPETTVAPSGLQVNSLNSNLKAAVPSGLQVSLFGYVFFGGGFVTNDNMQIDPGMVAATAAPGGSWVSLRVFFGML